MRGAREHCGVVVQQRLRALAQRLQPPSAAHWLGTDELGRDLLSRLIHGARLSLLIGLASVLLSLIPGILLGLVAGFFPRLLGPSIMRLMDIMLALPSLLLAVAIVAKDRKCSTSYIQRKLAIGYNKAARLVEQMEDQGVVSPANHVGKREVLVPEV